MSTKSIFFYLFSLCLFFSCNELNKKEFSAENFSNMLEEENDSNLPEGARIYKLEEDPLFQKLKSSYFQGILKDTNRHFESSVYQLPLFYFVFSLRKSLEVIGFIISKYQEFISPSIEFEDKMKLFAEIRKEAKVFGINEIDTKIFEEGLVDQNEAKINEFHNLAKEFITKLFYSFFSDLGSRNFRFLIQKVIRIQLIRLKNLDYSLLKHVKKLEELSYNDIMSLSQGDLKIDLLKIKEFKHAISPKVKEKGYIFPSLIHLMNTIYEEEGSILSNTKIINCNLIRHYLYERNSGSGKRDKNLSSDLEKDLDLKYAGLINKIEDLIKDLSSTEKYFLKVENTPFLKDNDRKSLAEGIQKLIKFLSAPEETENSFRETLQRSMATSKHWILDKAMIY